MITIVVAATILLTIIPITVGATSEVAYAWPAGTSEETKDKILTVQSDHELTVEESGIAEDTYTRFLNPFHLTANNTKTLWPVALLIN